MPASNTINLTDLVALRDSPQAASVFFIAQRQSRGRWNVRALLNPSLVVKRAGWWATATDLCGDTPTKYHPKYAMAILSAATPLQEPAPTLQHSRLPAIAFGTEEFTRRSMALNGMRMSLEYFESGSLRVLQLVEQRLAVGQRDVVHDVLVYLIQRVLDRRAEMQEARLLRAEAIAAYLGLNQSRVNILLLAARLTPRYMARQLEAGYAGPVRRAIDVAGLIESQIALLRPILRDYQHKERQALYLLDQVALLLSQSR